MIESEHPGFEIPTETLGQEAQAAPLSPGSGSSPGTSPGFSSGVRRDISPHDDPLTQHPLEIHAATGAARNGM
ncbi:MAG: hypothetical protein CL933_03790 [Deltaproteobacteria bacterium]|nr:hypothetical protein [Deltaproteobacteria bacterium]